MPKDEKDNDDFPLKDVLVLAADVVGAAAGATVGPFDIPLGTTLVAAAGLVSNLWTRVGQKRAARAYATLVSEWASVNGSTPTEAEATVRGLLENPGEHDEELYDTFRRLAFAKTDAAWPYIARITAQYVREKRPTDEFFKRVGWLLEGCEAGDIEVWVKAAQETRTKIGLDEHKDYDRVQWHAHDEVGVAVYFRNTDESEVSGGGHTAKSRVSVVEAIDRIATARLARRSDDGRIKFARGDILDRFLELFGR